MRKEKNIKISCYNRDTMKQERIKINELIEILKNKLS